MNNGNRALNTLMAVVVAAGSLSFFNEYAVAQVNTDPTHTGGPMRGRPGDAFLPGLRRLGDALQLTDAQRQSIRQVLKDARDAAASNAGAAGIDRQALMNPADPGHVAAVEAAKQRAASRVQQRADVEAKIYALLTPEQQAKLPQLLAKPPGRAKRS